MFGRSPVAAWERTYDKGTREERRKVALELMGKARELRAKDVLPFIECLLRDPDEDTGEYAAAALKYVGKPALPAAGSAFPVVLELGVESSGSGYHSSLSFGRL